MAEQRSGWMRWRPARLERSGRVLVAVGTLLLEPLAIASVLLAAWFITYFADDSADRGLGAITDLWPVWLVALGVIAAVIVAFARIVLGGRVALVAGQLGGGLVAVGALWMLITGNDDGVRTLAIAAGLAGGVALASGATARRMARGAFVAGAARGDG